MGEVESETRAVRRRAGVLALALLAGGLMVDTAVAAIATGPVVNPANGHAYCLLTANTWTASEVEAVSWGGHLATVNDAAENAWIVSTFSNSSRGLWIGLHAPAPTGTYVWTSGETPGYTQWAVNEPTDLAGELYVHILWASDTRAPNWNNATDVASFGGIPMQGVVENCSVTATAGAVASVPTLGSGALGLLAGLLGLLGFAGRRRCAADR